MSTDKIIGTKGHSTRRLLIISVVSALLGFGITFFDNTFGVVLGRALFVTVIDALPLYVLFVAIPSLIFRKRRPPFKLLNIAEKACGIVVLAIIFFVVGVWVCAWVDTKLLERSVEWLPTTIGMMLA